MVKSLLQQGVKMCTAPGQNCFMVAQKKWGWKCVKKLLEYDSDGVFVENDIGETLMMIYADNCEIIKELLALGANLNDRCSKQGGKTVLMCALNHPKANFEVIKCLLEAGADPNMIGTRLVPGEQPETVLSCAFNNNDSFNIEIIQLLFEKIDFNNYDYGLEHLIEFTLNKYLSCVYIKRGLKRCVHYRVETDHHRQMFLILQFLFKNSHIEATHHLYSPKHHPQSIIMSNWSKCIGIDTLDFFFKSNLMIPQLIVTQNIRAMFYDCEHVDFLPLSLFFNNLSIIFSDFDNLIPFIEKMLSLGYTLYHPDTVSIFVLIMMSVSLACSLRIKFITDDQDDQPNDESLNCGFLKLLKFLINNNGAHVGQIGFWEQNFALDSSHETLLRITNVPDAICSAVTSGHTTCVRLLLPYFGGPPLSLLLIRYQCSFHAINFEKLFSMLAEWGPLSPGSRLLSCVKETVDELHSNERLSHVAYEHFAAMHDSPPSLMHLCRCEIRQNLSEKASQPGYNLPDLILEISPPGLRDYLLMKPSEPINVVYCENLKLAEIGNIYYEHRFP